MTLTKTTFRVAGDRGLLVEYGSSIDKRVNQKIRSMVMALQDHRPNGVLEIIPAYCSILVIYDPAAITTDALETALLTQEGRLPDLLVPPPTVIDIPVCYEGKHGPDMNSVATRAGLTTEEVIRIHSEPTMPGNVQVPADGQPIILFAEQTVGGYAKIATVISTDLQKIRMFMMNQ